MTFSLIERVNDIDDVIDIINMKLNELKSIQINHTYEMMKLKNDNYHIKRTIKVLAAVMLVNCIGIISCLRYIYS